MDADADEKRAIPDAKRDALDAYYAGECERNANLAAGIRDTNRFGYSRIAFRDVDGYAVAYHADAVLDRNRGSS